MTDEDRAFLSLIQGVWVQLAAIALTYPAGSPKHTAVTSLQHQAARITAAAIAPNHQTAEP